MLSGHLPKLFALRSGRLLEPSELLAADDHLASCVLCRSTLPAIAVTRDMLFSIRRATKSTRGRTDHPSVQRMRTYLSCESTEVDRELTESHLQVCSQCRRRLSQLRSQDRLHK